MTPEIIQGTLKAGKAERKVPRGLNESCLAIEQGRAKCVFLADDVKEANYKTLITALAADRGVPLIKVDSLKTLGEWVGLAKYNEDGEVTKVVGCGVCVLKDWPVSGGKAAEDFKAALSSM